MRVVTLYRLSGESGAAVPFVGNVAHEERAVEFDGASGEAVEVGKPSRVGFVDAQEKLSIAGIEVPFLQSSFHSGIENSPSRRARRSSRLLQWWERAMWLDAQRHTDCEIGLRHRLHR